MLVSVAAGALSSTIFSVQSGTQVTLANNWALPTATSSCSTVHHGQSYGTGIYQGSNANAKHTKIWNNRITQCHKSLDLGGGSWDVEFIEGGSSDIGVNVRGYGEPSTINFYEDEHDVMAIAVGNNTYTPLVINNMRISNDVQRADGWIQITGAAKLFFQNGLLNTTGIQGNAVLFNFNLGSGAGILVASNNNYAEATNGGAGMTFAQTNYASSSKVIYSGDSFNGSGFQSGYIGLPTSCSGLPSGTLENASGTLSVCP